MSAQDTKAKLPKNISSSLHNILYNAAVMTEVGMDLKERFISGERYISYLKTVISGADKAISALHSISKSSLEQAQQLLNSVGEVDSSENFRHERERLLAVIENQIRELELHLDTDFENIDTLRISDKIRYLETRQKIVENNLNASTSSSKNLKMDINEKYPENLSRESLIDFNAVVNLPTVPEDIFTSFSNKPTRSSSLSSLKSMRKIKMYLQKAESSDDDDSSDADDHDYTKLVYGDCDDGRLSSPHSVSTKKILGNIKEESQD